MRLERLRGCRKRPFRNTTQRDPTHPVAKNLLKQTFEAQEPNQRWGETLFAIGSRTMVERHDYISTKQGWLYPAVVMGLFSRRIVGRSISQRMGRHLVVGALRMAIDARRPDGPLIDHLDRGTRYTSNEFREELACHGIECSTSAAANCYDIAAVESFFGVPKRTRVDRLSYRTREEARADLLEYIEVFHKKNVAMGILAT